VRDPIEEAGDPVGVCDCCSKLGRSSAREQRRCAQRAAPWRDMARLTPGRDSTVIVLRLRGTGRAIRASWSSCHRQAIWCSAAMPCTSARITIPTAVRVPFRSRQDGGIPARVVPGSSAVTMATSDRHGDSKTPCVTTSLRRTRGSPICPMGHSAGRFVAISLEHVIGTRLHPSRHFTCVDATTIAKWIGYFQHRPQQPYAFATTLRVINLTG